MNAQGLMAELASVLDITLDFNDENLCRIVFLEDIVDFEANQGPDGDSLFIIANLGNFIDDKAVLDRLLRANYLGAQSGGATISLSDEGFMMHRQLTMPMEYPDFEKALEHFVNSMRYWKEWIALPHEEATMISDSTLTTPMQGMLRI
ncbi:MAG: type III secretion system chaperone [Pseudomonadota bacterium]